MALLAQGSEVFYAFLCAWCALAFLARGFGSLCIIVITNLAGGERFLFVTSVQSDVVTCFWFMVAWHAEPQAMFEHLVFVWKSFTFSEVALTHNKVNGNPRGLESIILYIYIPTLIVTNRVLKAIVLIILLITVAPLFC